MPLNAEGKWPVHWWWATLCRAMRWQGCYRSPPRPIGLHMGQPWEAWHHVQWCWLAQVGSYWVDLVGCLLRQFGFVCWWKRQCTSMWLVLNSGQWGPRCHPCLLWMHCMLQCKLVGEAQSLLNPLGIGWDWWPTISTHEGNGVCVRVAHGVKSDYACSAAQTS